MLLSRTFNSDRSEKEYGMACIMAIANAALFDDGVRRQDIQCYRIMQGARGTADFDYLTGSGKMKYPAQVRFIPLIRPMFEILRSTNAKRPVKPRVYAVDPMTLDNKRDMMARRIVGEQMQKLFRQRDQVSLLQEQLKISMGQVQQAGQDGTQADPMTSLALKKVQLELNSAASMLENESLAQEHDIRKAERYFSHDFQTNEEAAMTGVMNYWLQKYRMTDVFQAGFEDLWTVDNEIYEIGDVTMGMDPVVNRHSPLFYYYPSEQGVTYVDECEWGMLETWMSPSSIVEAYGGELTHEQIERINEMASTGAAPEWYAFDARGGDELGNTTTSGDTPVYSGSAPAFGSIRVLRAVWKVNRKVKVDEEDGGSLVTDEDDPKDKAPDPTKYRWVNDTWEGYRIGSDIYFGIRKCPFQFRDQQKIGKSYLPFVGFAYNGVDTKPYSMTSALKDIQILYNLVHYQQEVLIALSGVKGFIMDTAQMPDGYSPSEWMYFLKQGVAFIQSRKEGQRDHQFNQFSTFDQTVSEGIKYLDGVLMRLEYLAGRISGIPPQRLGEVSASDQVGTYNASIGQSSLATEVLFYRHSRLVKRTLERVMEAGRLAWKRGKRGHYVAGDLGQKFFDLQEGMAGSCAYELFLQDQGEQQQNMEKALKIVEGGYAQGAFSTSQLIGMFNIDSLHELQVTLEHYEEIAQKRVQEAEQGKNMADSEKARLDNDYKLAIEKQKLQAQALQGNIDQARLQFDQQNAQTEAVLKNKEIDTRAQTEKYKTDMEAGVETGYIKEQAREHDNEMRLQRIEQNLERISASLSSQRPKEKIKDK